MMSKIFVIGKMQLRNNCLNLWIYLKGKSRKHSERVRAEVDEETKHQHCMWLSRIRKENNKGGCRCF